MASTRSGWFRRLAVFTAFACLAFIAPISSAAPAEATDAVAHAVDRPDPLSLAAPEAPDPIVMSCRDDQIDVNAPVDELIGLTTPAGNLINTPTLRRIVGGQPYLAPADVLAVSGVSKNHIAAWESNDLACAEPQSLPPETPDLCDGEVDVNDPESRDALAAMFGGPTADRIVDGIPYPSVHNSLRVAGVGRGKIKKLDEDLCATPYPILHDRTVWAYAYADKGLTAHVDGDFGPYSLVVPSGVIDGIGAWLTLEEVPSDGVNSRIAEFELSLDVPAVDAHIHGTWNGYVAVYLPEDAEYLADKDDVVYDDLMIHYGSQGRELIAKEDIGRTADGMLAVAVDDLSVLESVKLNRNWLVDRAADLEQVWRNTMGLGTTVSCNPDLTGQNPLPDGTEFSIESELFNPRPLTRPLNACVTEGRVGVGDGYPLSVRFGVNRGVVTRLVDQQNVNIPTPINVGSVQDGLLTGLGFFLDEPLVPPGSTFTMVPTAYTGGFSADMNTGVGLGSTLLYYVSDEIDAQLPPGLPQIINYAFWFADGYNCAAGLVTTLTSISDIEEFPAVAKAMITALQCAAAVLFRVFEEQLEFGKYVEWATQQNINAIPISDLGTMSESFDQLVLPRLKRALLALKMAKYATVVADIALTLGVDDDVEYHYRPPAPTYPTLDSKGRDIITDCVTQFFSDANGWVTRVNERCQDYAYGDFETGPDPSTDCAPVDASYDYDGSITCTRMYNVLRRDAAGVLHHILLQGGELVAHPISADEEWGFKKLFPEDEWRSDEFDDLIDRVGTPAYRDPLALRVPLDGRGGNWLLREANGNAWHIDGNGNRAELRGPSSYDTQLELSRANLTYHPATGADICLYPDPSVTGLIVCP